MGLSTYTEFLSDIEGWLDRKNLTARIPDFITLAHVRLNRELRVNWMTNTQTYLVQAADGIDFVLPERFNGMRSLKITNNPTQSLRYLTPENINEQNYENIGSKASFFTIVGGRLRVVPPPKEGDQLRMVFYQTAVPLVVTAQETNVFTINAPDALLYASLLEAKPYVKDDERMKIWGELYEKAIDSIKTQDNAIRWGEHSLESMAPYAAEPIARTSTG